MKVVSGVLCSLLLALTAFSIATATPLRLEYSVTDLGGGVNEYEFNLSLDDNDDSWTTGQGWALLVFGDVPSGTSPLNDFAIDSSDFPVGPWTSLVGASGGHNGPVFYPYPMDVSDFWVPTSIGETLTWSGTSGSYLGQGELFFSTLRSIEGGVRADFEVAYLSDTAPVPEPATALLLCFGLIGFAGFRKKFRK